MNNYEKIQYSMDLEEQKLKLEEQLEKVNEQIEQNKCDCNHIIVILGNKDTFPTYGKEYRCLLCGNHFQFLNEPELFVDARGFMKKYYDDLDPLKRISKFNFLRNITFEILEQNPELDNIQVINLLTGGIEAAKLDSNDLEFLETVETEAHKLSMAIRRKSMSKAELDL